MIYESVDYFNSKHDRTAYAELLNECVNVELKDGFGLSGYTAIEYCVNDTDRPPIGEIYKNLIAPKLNDFTILSDGLDKFAAYLVLTLILLLISSSTFDHVLRKCGDSKTSSEAIHYSNKPKSRVLQLLTIFSVQRNWNTMTSSANTDTQKVQLIQALRVLTMWLTIFGHVCIFSEFLPASPAELIEKVKYVNKKLSVF